MKTPSTSVVISTVANAARLGAALRLSARRASREEEAEPQFGRPSSPTPSSPRRRIARTRWWTRRPVEAGDLVAHDASLASSITRRRILSTISLSWVATITVVPVRLIR